ncbi:NAD(P)H-binding protein [Amycolatopsis thermalba]|uniref:NAD(P)H-binding protein n=1 Tax=Amycolatopsis thermalba TaxID=944492 RepID=A0ABY4P375_9PSEU|nr:MULTISPECIES: NAD(P)H-binding protein [Amycolatopsis]UQS26810.1 NAD(P)H-binding protein [Amycolatopsis thermalba]
MSRIVVFGAGGRAGRQVVAEAARRGHEVTAVVRDPGKHQAPEGVDLVAGDVTDVSSVAALVKGQDAVISTAAVYGEGTDPHGFFTSSARALVESGPARLIVVGLSVLAPDATGQRPVDAPGSPPEFRPFCEAHAAGLEVLRESPVDWLYVSPAGDFDHEGPRTGGYRVAAAADLADRVSYADFAIALIDEATKPAHRRQHLLVTTS